MTEALGQRFPDHPPCGGMFEKIVPHLTVAQGDDLDEAATAGDESPASAIASLLRSSVRASRAGPLARGCGSNPLTSDRHSYGSGVIPEHWPMQR